LIDLDQIEIQVVIEDEVEAVELKEGVLEGIAS
jgi:hypothetical protein